MKNLLRIAAFTSVLSALGWAWQGDVTPVDPAHRDGAHSGIVKYPRCIICGAHSGQTLYWVPYVSVPVVV
jgi:hypothetical protein